MQWEDERYVRVYKRDTADWLALSFDAQGLFCLLLRKVDLSGRLALGRHNTKAVAVVMNQVALWDSRLKPALDELLSDGCVELQPDCLFVPNYEAAQQAVASPRLRKRIQRQRDAEETERDRTDTNRDAEVTNSQVMSRAVTDGHARSHQPSQPSQPDCTEPTKPEESSATRAKAPDTPRNGEGQKQLPDPWPRDAYLKAQQLLGVDDTDQSWGKFVGDCIREGFSVAARVAGVEQLAKEGHKPGGAGPGLLLAIIKRFAKAQANGTGVGMVAPVKPKWKSLGFDSELAWLEAKFRARHDMPLPEPLPKGWEQRVRSEIQESIDAR